MRTGVATEIEHLASTMRKRAGVGAEEIVDAGEFAVRLIGPECFIVLEHLAVGARLRRDESDSYIIEIRDNLPDVNFCCAHEVAHWGLAELAGYVGPDEERLANSLAAALLAPASFVRRHAVHFGASLSAVRPLARAVRISQTSSNIRLSEVLRDERAVLTSKSGNVLHRSDSLFPWADETALKKHWRGLAKAKLRGGIDEGRTALMIP